GCSPWSSPPTPRAGCASAAPRSPSPRANSGTDPAPVAPRACPRCSAASATAPPRRAPRPLPRGLGPALTSPGPGPTPAFAPHLPPAPRLNVIVPRLRPPCRAPAPRLPPLVLEVSTGRYLQDQRLPGPVAVTAGGCGGRGGCTGAGGAAGRRSGP